MTNKVIILGAGGRFGRAATKAFLQCGWRVTVLVRSSESTAGSSEKYNSQKNNKQLNYVNADVYSQDSLSRAVKGHDLIINALNPPYPNWAKDVPRLTDNVISAALSASATIMLPGNVYNYGETIPSSVSELTPQIASTQKGQIRIQMEQQYKLAAKHGLQTIILRAGDFIEKRRTGNWFDSHIMNRIDEKIVTYPGPLDRQHAWAYLPDLAQAMVLIAERRAQFDMFEEFGFEGFSVTGQELVHHAENVLESTLTIKKMPWAAMRFASLFSPMLREVMEMRYLWNMPHRIDGVKLSKALAGFVPKSLDQVLKEVFTPEKTS